MIKWLQSLLGREELSALPTPKPPTSDIYKPVPPAESQGFAKPRFRFFPGCYEFRSQDHEVFEKSSETCEVCGKRDIWRYNGTIYWTLPEETIVCAQCISEGNLAELVPPDKRADNQEARLHAYSFHDTEVDGLDWRDPLAIEVKSRTPGFPTFNPFEWPSIGGVPMAFMGYGDEEKWKDVSEARAAMKEANGGEDHFPCPFLLIFKEIDGPRLKAVIDPD
ncbi:MAG: CbrC family protein [Pseudomonadota bacterium]